MSPLVVRTGDGSKPLLSCGVPYLQFDGFGVDGEGPEWWMGLLEFEVDADGGEVWLLEGVVGKAAEEGGFADGAIAGEYKFINMVAAHKRFRIYEYIIGISL